MADFPGELIEPFELVDGYTAAQLLEIGLGVASIDVLGVAQYSLNSVDVGFSTYPKTFDPALPGDALNPDTYTVTRSDGSPSPFMQTVEMVGPGVVRLYVDAPFDAGESYDVEVSSLLESEDGETLGEDSGSFVAVARGRSLNAIDKVRASRTDIMGTAGADSIEAGLRYDETGDLANQSGAAYLRKRIVRRLTTALGGFFHLPAYGAGAKLKSKVSESRVSRMEKLMQAQCELEPDVRRARVVVTLRANSVARVVATIIDAEGESLRVTTNLDLAGD